MVQPSSYLKIHPITDFLLVIVIALVNPLRFLKQAGGLLLLATGLFPMESHLVWVLTIWHTVFPDTLSNPASSWAVTD